MHADYLVYQVQIACGGWDISDRPRSIEDLRTFITGFKSFEAEPVPGYVFQILDVLELNNCGESATYSDAKCGDYLIPLLRQYTFLTLRREY